MKSYKNIKSTIKPKEIVIDEYSVWVHSNISEISENVGTENEFIGFSYDLKQYSKNEYIKYQIEEQKKLTERMNNTQIALCEIYESLGGKI